MSRLLRLVPLLAVALVSCTDSMAPRRRGPPYLAIVPRWSTSPEAALAGAAARYRVTMLSTPSTLDTTFVIGVRDTVILSVDPATYQIELDNVPDRCPVRDGGRRVAVVAPGASTAIVRYSITCRLMLTVQLSMQGINPPTNLRWRLVGDRVSRLGNAAPNDTLIFDDIPPGPYSIELREMPSNCQITTPSKDNKTSFDISAAGNRFVQVAVECYDPPARPRIINAYSSYADGAAALYVKYFDRQFDGDAVTWDITNCSGVSLLPTGSVTRRVITSGGLFLRDTMEFGIVLEPTFTASVAANACSRIRLIDRSGNSSEIIEQPLNFTRGTAPRFTTFNSIFVGFGAIETTLSADDAEQDIAATVIGYTLRDGALGNPPNGAEDKIFARSIGFPGLTVPRVQIGTASLPPATDWRSTFVYIIDRGGNFARLQDRDLTR
jgi:hypothetical protein